MKKIRRTSAVAANIVFGLIGSALAEELAPAPFIDGASRVEVENLAVVRQEPVQLVAPELPAVAVELPATVAPADQDDQSPAERRQQVGYVLPAPANLVPRAFQAMLPAGHLITRLELRSQRAEGLRLQFKGLAAGSGVELRVYDPAGPAVLGPYTAPILDEDGTWWSPTIFGDTIGLELMLPADLPIPVLMPEVTAVAYLYCGVQCHAGPGTTLACHNDVTCSPTWANAEGRAVGAMHFTSGTGCFQCTGALLNRSPEDFSPLFMTANHCIQTQAEANSLEVLWNYQSDPPLPGQPCPGTAPALNTVPRTTGALLLKQHPGTDWTLLGLHEQPVGDTYLGWNANSWASGDSATGIHHPRGSWKRISFGTSTGSTDGSLFCDPRGATTCSCTNPPNLCISVNVFTVSYTNGAYEPGSSGSPVFDGSRRVRGTLTGGPAACSPVTANYGRFDQAFTNLRYYLLDPASPTVFVNGSLVGDPVNNGNNERGTALNPFNSVYEATFCVRSGEEVRVTPGTYNEQVTIRRPMQITRGGTSGVVRIGG